MCSSDLPFVVGETGLSAILSRRVAERLKDVASIQVHQPPFPTAKLYLDAFWSKTADFDPGHLWFRRILLEECQKLD